MSKQWILVANSSLARMFSRESPAEPLVPLVTLAHAESRMTRSELTQERSGTEANDHSRGPNHLTPRSDPHRKEQLRFAQEIAKHLDQALARGEFESLLLFASKPFMGELRGQMGKACAARVKGSVEHDYTGLGLSEIELRVNQLGHAHPAPAA